MKRVSWSVGVVASIAVAVVAFAGSTRVARASAAAGDPVKGAVVYTAQKCNVCHKVNGTGGPIGPDLSTIGLKRDAVWLAKYLPNPVVIDPKNPPKVKMTATKAKGEDLENLIAYLLTLKGKK